MMIGILFVLAIGWLCGIGMALKMVEQDSELGVSAYQRTHIQNIRMFAVGYVVVAFVALTLVYEVLVHVSLNFH